MMIPFFNVLNGEEYSENKAAFRGTMIAPVGAFSIAEAVRIGSEVYQHLKKVIIESSDLLVSLSQTICKFASAKFNIQSHWDWR